MSFSGEVKEELSRHDSQARHCQIAELATLLQFSGIFSENEEKIKVAVRKNKTIENIKLQGENVWLLQKCFTLIEKTFNIKANIYDKSTNQIVEFDEMREKNDYCILIEQEEQIKKIIKTIKYTYPNEENAYIVEKLLLKTVCCKRAFLRGAFLAIGSMSNPEKSYHLEFVCITEQQANQIIEIMTSFELEGKLVQRKKYYVVYIKEGEGIVELLNIMGAHKALMNFENYRILKEMRNDINRRVNCEAANITKTVNASTKQIEDIEFVRKHYGFKKLPESLRTMAELRLEYPEATLKELGEYLNPVVGKSGVNHRLRKLSELADKLRVGM